MVKNTERKGKWEREEREKKEKERERWKDVVKIRERKEK